MQPHPLSLIFPDMSNADYEALKADIKKNGLREKIVTFEDKILDGRHRWKACEELAVQPILSAYTGKDPAGYVLSKNFARRHLDVSQRAAIAAEMSEHLPKQKPAKKATPQVCGESLDPNTDPFGAPNESHSSKSTQAAAKAMNVSPRSVEAAVSIKKNSPERFAEVKAGKKTLNEAVEEIKRETPVIVKPKNQLEEFKAQGKELRDAAIAVHNAGKVVSKLIESGNPIAAYIHDQSVDAAVEQFKSAIKFAQPYAICPYCKGKKCKDCRNTGWIPKIVNDNLPRELRQ